MDALVPIRESRTGIAHYDCSSDMEEIGTAKVKSRMEHLSVFSFLLSSLKRINMR